jgi:hypothetical protein
MPESSFALTYNDLLGEVGSFLGFGRGSQNGEQAWTAQQQNRIDSFVKSGLSRFYFPDVVEGQTTGHSWSFLHPTATLVLTSGNNTVPMPDDFGGFEGQLNLAPINQQTWWPIKLYNEGMLNEAYARLPTLSSRPQMAAVQWKKGSTATAGQRANLFFYPIPDQNYTLLFQYYTNPDYLTGAFPYPLGGAQHAETIKEACLAAAEELFDDMGGVHAQRFQARLQAAIAMDQKNKAISLGYNRDDSDGWYGWNNRWNHGLSPITFSDAGHQ